MESCFCHLHVLFDLQRTQEVEIKHTNFHFYNKKVTSKSRKVKVFTWKLSKNFRLFDLIFVYKSKVRKVEVCGFYFQVFS